jgi:predicted component of type VI protein secretion system
MDVFDAISTSLGAATAVAPIPRPTQDLAPPDAQKEAPEIEDDYNEARSNLKELISQAMEMVPELVDLTKQAQSDKMYSAASTFIKTAADLNISLSKLSKEIKQPAKGKVQTEQVPVQQITNNNLVFSGSTEDFLDMIEEREKAKKEAILDAEYVAVENGG